MASLFGLLTFAQNARTAITVTLEPSADNTIYQDNPNNSNGLGGYFIAGNTSSSSPRRALLRFDLSSIPAGSTVSSVSLQLTLNKTKAGATTMNLHKVSAAWGEGTSNAGSDPGGNDGSGVAATAGDATWIRRVFNTTNWTTAGGDFSATVSGTTSVGTPGVFTWSGAQMITDVQGWVNTASTNFGWLLKSTEAGSKHAKRFASRNNATAADRPKLTVVYTGPTPVTLAFFKANEVNRGVQLTWQTQSEYNNASFTVEHSLDGTSFNALGKVNGAGTSTTPKDYSLLHQAVMPGKHYYRLLQTDVNGRGEYSQVLVVNIKSAHTTIQINPNPVKDILNISGIATDAGMNYFITNSSGVQVATGRLSEPKVNVSSLTPGYYNLVIKDGIEIYTSKFIIR